MRGPSRDHGFALIIVLWGLVVIGLLISHLTAAGRTEAKIARNMIANAEASAAADGGIAAAIYHLTQSDENVRWQADGAAHTIKIGSITLSVRSWSEAGKINPNLASDALMSALLQATGVDASRAETLALSIGGWHDLVRQSRQGGGAGDYAAAGLDYGPPGSSIEDIGELHRVLGMTPDNLSKLRPHLSLWIQSESPVETGADPVVARAVELVAKKAGVIVAPMFRPTLLTVSILAEATASSGARFTRHAVVQTGPGLEKGYRILAWDTGQDEE
jgi:general secretion pathway protein K